MLRKMQRRTEKVGQKRARERRMGVGAHIRASLGHLAALSQPIHAATATADDFPLRPDGRIPRAAKSPPSAVLRLTLRPARSLRVLACLAWLFVSRTPRDRRHEPKARGEIERRNATHEHDCGINDHWPRWRNQAGRL